MSSQTGVVPKLSGWAVMAVCFLTFARIAAAGSPPLGTQIKGNHPIELDHPGRTVHADPTMRLNLTIVLGIHDQAALEKLLAEQQDPSSALYHRWLTPRQFNAHFGPSTVRFSALVQWLRARGSADHEGQPARSHD